MKFSAQTFQEVTNELSSIQSSQLNKSDNLVEQINNKLVAISEPQKTCSAEEGSLISCYLNNKKDPSLCKAAIHTYLACVEKNVVA